MTEIQGKSILVRVSEGSSYRKSTVNVFSAINCFLHSPRSGAIPWSLGTRGVFYLMDRNLLCMCAVPWRMIFCSSLMLLAPGIFHKFWSIPHLISPSAPTITGVVSVLIPHILVVSISRSFRILRACQWLSSRCFGRMVPIHLYVCNTGWHGPWSLYQAC